MILNNAVLISVPKTPDILKEKLTFIANEALTYIETKMFELCLAVIADKLIEDKIAIYSLTHLNVLFTKNGSFSMEEESGDRFGMHFNLAIYALDNLRKTNNDHFMLFTFVEELVHHLWQIEDEKKAKYKVLEIVERIDPKITLDLLKEWHVNGIQ